MIRRPQLSRAAKRLGVGFVAVLALIAAALFIPSWPKTLLEEGIGGDLPLTYRTLSLQEALRTPDQAGLGQPCGARPVAGTPNFQQDPSPWRGLGHIDLSAPYVPYFGNLHAHTALSDNEGGTQEEAYAYARDVAKLDFFAVTDHPEYWLFRQKDYYERQKKIALASARPGYIPLVGFEYSSAVHGHFVVLNTEHVRNSFQDATLTAFYQWLEEPEQKEALVIFAHPGFHAYRRASEFAHFRLEPPLIAKMAGLEVIHWDGWRPRMNGYRGRLPYFDEALLAGWRVGSIASEDNHSPNWGTRDPDRIGMLLPKLDRTEIIAALRARRYYATSSKDLLFAVNLQKRDGTWATMGEALSTGQLPTDSADVRVRYYDYDCAFWPKRLEAVINGRVAGTYQFAAPKVPDGFPFAGEWRTQVKIPPLKGKRAYLYFRFYQGEDEETFTQSSPIFLDLDRP